jgi:hypothetical protein
VVSGSESFHNGGVGGVAGARSHVFGSYASENRQGGMSLDATSMFHGSVVLDNYLVPPVSGGIEPGSNLCKERGQSTPGPC